MQTITRKYKVYSFNELDKKAQERAIEDERQYHIQFNDNWHDMTIEEAEGMLEELGYSDAEIGFSGFSSQGDGASFTASVDLAKWLKVKKLGNKYRLALTHADNVSASIRRTSHQYLHEYTIEAEIGDHYLWDLPADVRDRVDTQLSKLEELLTEDAREQSRKIYKGLEQEWDYILSDEYLIEELRARDDEFLADGQLFTQ